MHRKKDIKISFHRRGSFRVAYNGKISRVSMRLILCYAFLSIQYKDIFQYAKAEVNKLADVLVFRPKLK